MNHYVVVRDIRYCFHAPSAAAGVRRTNGGKFPVCPTTAERCLWSRRAQATGECGSDYVILHL